MLKPNAATQRAMDDAEVDRADNGAINLLFKLGEFLSTLLHDAFRHATEQATSSAEKDFANMVSFDECDDMVAEKICEWATRTNVYNEEELLLHKKMYDVMTRDKSGLPKKQDFARWSLRVALHSENITPVTEDAEADSTATEHADFTASFRKLVEDIFEYDLTPEQMQDPRYKIEKDKAIT